MHICDVGPLIEGHRFPLGMLEKELNPKFRSLTKKLFGITF